MSFLAGCSQSPTRIVNSCGFKVVPNVSDMDALGRVAISDAGMELIMSLPLSHADLDSILTPVISNHFLVQVNDNQDLYDLCMKGI